MKCCLYIATERLGYKIEAEINDLTKPLNAPREGMPGTKVSEQQQALLDFVKVAGVIILVCEVLSNALEQ